MAGGWYYDDITVDVECFPCKNIALKEGVNCVDIDLCLMTSLSEITVIRP